MAKAYAILCLRQNEINDLQKSTKQNPHEFAPHGGFYSVLARWLKSTQTSFWKYVNVFFEVRKRLFKVRKRLF